MSTNIPSSPSARLHRPAVLQQAPLQFTGYGSSYDQVLFHGISPSKPLSLKSLIQRIIEQTFNTFNR